MVMLQHLGIQFIQLLLIIFYSIRIIYIIIVNSFVTISIIHLVMVMVKVMVILLVIIVVILQQLVI
jgi:hypothetical protein